MKKTHKKQLQITEERILHLAPHSNSDQELSSILWQVKEKEELPNALIIIIIFF